ncbi:nuclear transport factor 2 family protein [Rummeliibacillus suwonensis]|uniref:nuclear transport factor 2 family protein n=1 Tax=Rummeliibacillus suwonensis TaxID=1306154 RepID=UPI00289CCE20|nr:DUF4440 domain-containing protein [Rummeliibacillus suwonensis]
MEIYQLKEHLKSLEEKLLTDEVRKSPKELKKYLTENYFEFGSSGQVWYMEKYLNENGIGIIDATISNFQLHLLAEDVALVTYYLENRTRQNHSLRSSIWKKLNEKWTMVFHQGTITES